MYRGLTSSYQRGGSWGWVRRVNELSKEKKKTHGRRQQYGDYQRERGLRGYKKIKVV